MEALSTTRYLLLTILVVSIIAPLTINASIAKAQQWPWGEKEEPYPWLDYLASLTTERNVKLVIITRHESTILVKTKEIFLKSPVAQKLGITDLIFLPIGPELWDETIRKYKERGVSVDVAWGGGPTLFNYMDELGHLLPLNVDKHPEFYAILYEMNKIPEEIAGAPTRKADENGIVHWIGAAISSFGFTVNHKLLQKYNVPKPSKWSDLASPVYAKYLPQTPLVGIADPFKSTSNTRMYEIILQAYGWDEGWKVLTLMAANSRIYDSSSGVRDDVIRGAIAVGITIDFYGYTAMKQNPDCEYVIPEGESIVNADPIAVLSATKYPVHAAAFVAWVLSEFGGQQIWLDPDINRLPINAKVFDTDPGKERPDLKEAFEKASVVGAIKFNESLASATELAMQAYFKATLVEAHYDLQRVWAEIAKAYLDGKITEEQFNFLIDKLTEPFKFKDPLTGQETTFTIEYAMKINKKLTEAAVFGQLMDQWKTGAINRYQKTYEYLKRILAGEWPIKEETPTTPTTSPSTSPTTLSPSPSPSPTTTTITQPTTQPTTTTPTTSPVQTPTPTTTPAGGLPSTTLYTVIGILILIIIVVGYIIMSKRR